MSQCELVCVPPSYVATILPIAEPLLRSALAHTGIGDYSDLESGISAGDQLLWLALDLAVPDQNLKILAAASTQLQLAAAGRICVITACGGHSLSDWLHLFAHTALHRSVSLLTRS